MDRMVERIVDWDQASTALAMATMLYGLPRPVGDVDAIAVQPGLGENWRIIDAVEAWNESASAKRLLIAGLYDGETTKVLPTIENLSRPPFNLRRTEGVHIQASADHTRAQAEWLAKQVRENGVGSLALFVSPYHLLRAYCTVLKTFTKAGLRIPIVPMPVAVAPTAIVPETGVNAWEMSPGEKERIFKYQELGDVATLDELMDYLRWLCEQPIMANRLKC